MALVGNATGEVAVGLPVSGQVWAWPGGCGRRSYGQGNVERPHNDAEGYLAMALTSKSMQSVAPACRAMSRGVSPEALRNVGSAPRGEERGHDRSGSGGGRRVNESVAVPGARHRGATGQLVAAQLARQDPSRGSHRGRGSASLSWRPSSPRGSWRSP